MVLQNCNKATFINSLTEITLLLIYLDFWGLVMSRVSEGKTRSKSERGNEDRRLALSLPGGHYKLLPLKDLMSWLGVLIC